MNLKVVQNFHQHVKFKKEKVKNWLCEIGLNRIKKKIIHRANAVSIKHLKFYKLFLLTPQVSFFYKSLLIFVFSVPSSLYIGFNDTVLQLGTSTLFAGLFFCFSKLASLFTEERRNALLFGPPNKELLIINGTFSIEVRLSDFSSKFSAFKVFDIITLSVIRYLDVFSITFEWGMDFSSVESIVSTDFSSAVGSCDFLGDLNYSFQYSTIYLNSRCFYDTLNSPYFNNELIVNKFDMIYIRDLKFSITDLGKLINVKFIPDLFLSHKSTFKEAWDMAANSFKAINARK
ncbi:hypothetical protein BpHYR1_025220 [Brachionus plicatilis]|uniref:Uncharacterized protein n=1 Tax=Brachionus plicatilis TaxID=10195 RepID=A0A3M7QL55_BRAPC|nr:hypothetical protein BpHYR1_025220 [Brachionus plicatilis]